MMWEELYEENTRARAELAEQGRALSQSNQQVAELRDELAVVLADAAVKQDAIEQLRATVRQKDGELGAAHSAISLLKKERPQRLRAERQARVFAKRARDAGDINVILGGLALVASIAAANRDE